ncbi:hypothetical protein EVAR_15861_1 [Eumeta japonica]|uniref:Uncharacterized protein n=1 Tax=Eumeta variegata TaxID=151549 RepID=A0A4C1UDZ1_EUMVA|nr:hypothetical protein EVAR_15861_1 [Eumeta japonica]
MTASPERKVGTSKKYFSYNAARDISAKSLCRLSETGKNSIREGGAARLAFKEACRASGDSGKRRKEIRQHERVHIQHFTLRGRRSRSPIRVDGLLLPPRQSKTDGMFQLPATSEESKLLSH